MPRPRAIMAATLVALVVACANGPATAQTYPTKPVTIVVPFAPGGGNDILARLLGQHMGRALGQQFVVENRPGAAGSIGADAVAKATPDGYTLLVGHSGVFGVVPSLYAPNAGFDPRKDFAGRLIASFTQILAVHPSVRSAHQRPDRSQGWSGAQLRDRRRRLGLPHLDRAALVDGRHQAAHVPIAAAAQRRPISSAT